MSQILRRFIQTVQTASGLNAKLDVITRQLVDILPADLCAIYWVDEHTAEYALGSLHSDNPNAQLLEPLRIQFGQGLVGLVAERAEAINIPDLHRHPAYLKHPFTDIVHLHGFLGVPLIAQGELLGVLLAERHAIGAFKPEEAALLTTLAAQLSDDLLEAKETADHFQPFGKTKKPTKTPKILQGIASAPGVAIGRAVVVYPPADLEAVPDREADDIASEIAAFKTALMHVRQDIQKLHQRAQRSLSVAEQSLFDVYLRILDSHSLMEEVVTEMQHGQWAPAALKRVVKRHVSHFEALEDPYLRERATDFRDLGRRILSHLQQDNQAETVYPKQTILVSEEITATALMEVPEGHLVGVVSSTGSTHSHVAILTRALGVPTVMSCSGISFSHVEGKPLIVDGYNGEVYVSPSPAVKKQFQQLMVEETEFEAELGKLRDLPAETTDGHVIQLMINAGLAADSGDTLSVGADGVGLYRTEVPFMLRDRFPSEEEQRLMYRQLLNTFAPKTVIMRTLDIGGDKALPYFPVVEENPFLGWRGLRITLDHPEIFLQQLRAMLQASVDFDNLAIMFPMVTSIREIEAAKQLVKQAFEELCEEGHAVVMPPLGLMIEVPAAVYQAQEFANRVDFLSVGSNDLIQYMLAVDRNNARVADLYDPFHPAVLRALSDVVAFGHKGGASVSICGELASDPLGVVLLLGMGYDALSMNATSLPRIKSVIRKFSLKRAKALVAEVIKLDDSREIRETVEQALMEAGLAGLIRAGK